ncbi:flagellar protein FlaG [Massilia sp. G4R7]|uniref:Flagellar protein FlaG n=1 Tax=Massilia phyllostachyos TaxID=2898585 RepID=A0ABS8Q3P9_9BURK|nr:flagellar protein FlaG [Massilia phyllostachyos]MCD2515692.1 flagellar protein FlaG [Massilia phyllostachyos]
MNIQPFGASVTPKLDDRPAPDSIATRAPATRQPDAAPAEQEAKPPSRKELDEAVKKINGSMPPAARSLEFSVDDESKQTVVKIIDVSTKEVVRQIPTTEALEIAKSLDKAMGRLISQKA